MSLYLDGPREDRPRGDFDRRDMGRDDRRDDNRNRDQGRLYDREPSRTTERTMERRELDQDADAERRGEFDSRRADQVIVTPLLLLSFGG